MLVLAAVRFEAIRSPRDGPAYAAKPPQNHVLVLVARGTGPIAGMSNGRDLVRPSKAWRAALNPRVQREGSLICCVTSTRVRLSLPHASG